MRRKKVIEGILLVIVVLGIITLTGGEKSMQPRFINVQDDIICTGLKIRTTRKTIYKDLPKVYASYMSMKEKGQVNYIKKPWEYISLSMNFDSSQAWDYYTGYVVEKFEPDAVKLVNFEIPQGDYAVFEIRFKSKIFFGWKMGKLKRYIYTKWLPASGYEFTGFEYEYSNEEMARKSIYDIDLYVGIKKK